MPKIKEENKEETVVVIAVKSTYYLIDLMTGQRRIARARVRLKKKTKHTRGVPRDIDWMAQHSTCRSTGSIFL